MQALRLVALLLLGIAVTVGVGRDVFSELALFVAGFDLLTAVVGAVYLWRARP